MSSSCAGKTAAEIFVCWSIQSSSLCRVILTPFILQHANISAAVLPAQLVEGCGRFLGTLSCRTFHGGEVVALTAGNFPQLKLRLKTMHSFIRVGKQSYKLTSIVEHCVFSVSQCAVFRLRVCRYLSKYSLPFLSLFLLDPTIASLYWA